MTIEELVARLASRPWAVLAALAALPLASLLLGAMHPPRRGGASPWKYLHAALVWAACVPGTFAAVLVLYAFLFRRDNLLQLSIPVHFAPILAMVATLLATRRAVNSFEEVPSFGRLSGLMLLLGVSIGVAFAVDRARFGVFFLGPVTQLATIAAAVYALLALGGRLLAGRERRLPPLPPPPGS